MSSVKLSITSLTKETKIAFKQSAEIMLPHESSSWLWMHYINRLTYASPAWWGFCGTGEKEQLGAVVARLVRRQFLPPDQPSLQDIIDAADMRFFLKILGNPCHVLASPPTRTKMSLIDYYWAERVLAHCVWSCLSACVVLPLLILLTIALH